VAPNVDVTPCLYMENAAGSVKEASFKTIWENAPVLNALRALKLEGRCGACEFQQLCAAAARGLWRKMAT